MHAYLIRNKIIKWSVNNCINAEWPQQDKLRSLKFFSWVSCIAVFSFSCAGNFAYTISFQKVHFQKFSIQVPVITIATINPAKLMQLMPASALKPWIILVSKTTIIREKNNNNKTKQKQDKSQERGKVSNMMKTWKPLLQSGWHLYEDGLCEETKQQSLERKVCRAKWEKKSISFFAAS